MQKLQFLIDMLTKGRKIHISVLDISGVLNTAYARLDYKNVIHSKAFCDAAKSTQKGFRCCIHCKYLANTRAIEDKKPFCGHCSYGIFEVAMPVVIGESVAAVVYVGNAVTDKDYTRARIEKVSRYTRVDRAMLLSLTEECEYTHNTEELFGIAEIVCDHIKAIHKAKPQTETKRHWLVAALKQHADEGYCSGTTLKELSVLYHKNEKYLGRLFKKEMGMSFHQYCLSLRLKKAELMLLGTSEKVIDVALECGFNNIPYFNRAFKAQYGSTPGEHASKMNRK